MADDVIHLHILYAYGPQLLRGVHRGYSLCSVVVERAGLTSFVDDATCPDCLRRHTAAVTAEEKPNEPTKA